MLEIVKEYASKSDNNVDEIRSCLFEVSSHRMNPVDYVRWVDIDKVESNNYNPNAVARIELKLLLLSIQKDGYTQPIVTIYDNERDKYVIVDGFHRYFVMKSNADLLKLNDGKLPIVVIDKDINERKASTVRHNRARGTHSFEGMANLVLEMSANGWADEQICEELGMEADELVRLKYVTGYASLYKKTSFGKSWTVAYMDDENEVSIDDEEEEDED